MDKQTANQLAARIERDDPRCRVTGVRRRSGAYALDVADTRTGVPFVVRSPEEWAERTAEAALYAVE